MPVAYLTEQDYPEDICRIRMGLIREMRRAVTWCDLMEIYDCLEAVNRRAKAMARESRLLEPERWHQVVNEATTTPRER